MWTAATAQSSPGDDVFPPGVKAMDKVFTEVKAEEAEEGRGRADDSFSGYLVDCCNGSVLPG